MRLLALPLFRSSNGVINSDLFLHESENNHENVGQELMLAPHISLAPTLQNSIRAVLIHFVLGTTSYYAWSIRVQGSEADERGTG